MNTTPQEIAWQTVYDLCIKLGMKSREKQQSALYDVTDFITSLYLNTGLNPNVVSIMVAFAFVIGIGCGLVISLLF